MAQRITNQQLQQQNELLQKQLEQQHQNIQNLTAIVNELAQNLQANQEAIQQLLAQGNQGGQPPMGPQLPDEAEVPEEPHEPAVVQIVPPPLAPIQQGIYTLEKFIKNGAKYFKGTTEPEKAEAWTLNMLKTFRAMEVPENHWVRLASCMFEEEAAFWWEAALRTNFVGREFQTITWAELMEAFNVTYYPETVREQKSREFSNLKQGEMNVREYEQKFIQLERFAPGLCATEKARTSKFVWGLRFALKDRVASQRPRTLAAAVATACVAEEVLNEQYGALNKKDKSKETTIQDQSFKKNKESDKRKRNDDQETKKKDLPTCPTCGKKHGGECWKNTNKCYACGEVGHVKRNCPKEQQNKKEKEQKTE